MEENFVICHAAEWRMEKSFFDTGAESPVFTAYGIQWKLKLKIISKKSYRSKNPFLIHLIAVHAPVGNTDMKFTVSYRWKREHGKKTPESSIDVKLSDLTTNVNTGSVIGRDALELHRIMELLDTDFDYFSAASYVDDLYFAFSIRPTDDDLVSLQLHGEQFSTVSLPCIDRLSRDFEKALSNSEHTDIILRCGDKTIPAHKVILSCRSDVFQAMFRNNLKESQEGVVDIVDVEPTVFEKVIHYIYTGSLRGETLETVCNIYKAAHKYSIQALKERCIQFIKGNIVTDQVCDLLLMADLYQDSELKMFVMTYIIYRKEFLLSEPWISFSKEHNLLAQEVFLLFVRKAKVI